MKNSKKHYSSKAQRAVIGMADFKKIAEKLTLQERIMLKNSLMPELNNGEDQRWPTGRVDIVSTQKFCRILVPTDEADLAAPPKKQGENQNKNYIKPKHEKKTNGNSLGDNGLKQEAVLEPKEFTITNPKAKKVMLAEDEYRAKVSVLGSDLCAEDGLANVGGKWRYIGTFNNGVKETKLYQKVKETKAELATA